MFISLSFWRHYENKKNLGKLVLATVSKPQWSTVHYYTVVKICTCNMVKFFLRDSEDFVK